MKTSDTLATTATARRRRNRRLRGAWATVGRSRLDHLRAQLRRRERAAAEARRAFHNRSTPSGARVTLTEQELPATGTE